MTAKTRNIGIVAHINAGKTTLSERMLFLSGRQSGYGEVDEGTAVLDFLPEEQRRGISIASALSSLRWRGYTIQVIDTPGHVDFGAEVERCLRVLDGLIVVLDGHKGVESQTRSLWRSAVNAGLPCLLFVNKLDRSCADFASAVNSAQRLLECTPVPVVVPLRGGDDLAGLVEVVSGKAINWRDASDTAQIRAEARESLLAACAEFDQQLMHDWIQGVELEPARIHAVLRAGTLARRIVPVIAGAALHNHGVNLLLDAVCRYLPGPADRDVPQSSVGDRLWRPPVTEPFCALVFKILHDGDERLPIARVFSGQIEPGTEGVELGCNGIARVRLQKLWGVHGALREPLTSAAAGDLVAMELSQPCASGDTLHEPNTPYRLEELSFPEPVLTRTLEPGVAADLAELRRAAQSLCVDDPSLRLEADADGALLISGMGELHLDVFEERLAALFRRPFRLGNPQVARRWTVTRAANSQAEYRTVHPQATASVEVALEPARGIGEVEIEDRAKGPPGLRKLLIEELHGMARGGLGYPFPAQDLRIVLARLVVVAEDEAHQFAALQALAIAAGKAFDASAPVILEPRAHFEVTCPHEHLSAVLADLRARDASPGEVGVQGDYARVEGEIWLRETLGYATRLRSISQGLACQIITPERFAPRPSSKVEGGP